MNRRIYLLAVLLLASLVPCVSKAQDALPAQSWFKANNVLDHLQVSGTLGTTGLGVELQAPLTRWANVRAGFSAFPAFHVALPFQISAYAGDNVSGNLDKIKDLMAQVTGEEMLDEVEMNGKPSIWNVKLLFDIFPFRNNRHWHFTAGFYAGSRMIGSALNKKNATNTLVAMNIYNRFYDRLEAGNSYDEPFFGDIYLTPEMYEEFLSYGRMGIHLGERKDGTPYYLLPESNGTVSAKVFANAFKPYLGAGYSTQLDKRGLWSLGVDAGVLMWGGAPQVILNDGTNMNKDLRNVRGKVGDYLDFIKGLGVFPVLEVKITYNIK